MNRPDSKKRPAKSNRVAGKSAAVVPGGAPSAGAVHMAGAPRGSSSPAAGGSPGACDLPTPRAPTTGGFPIVGGFPVLGASFTGQPSPNSTEWIYPQGGFMNFLQSPKVPFVNYPNGSQQPENFHFVGGPMKYSVNPSPTGSSDAGAAQVGSQVTETIDVEDDDTIQPINSNARANARSIARSIAPSDARSDRRLNWSNEEDIRLVSAWLHNSIDPIDGNDKKADQYWSDVTSTYNSTTKCDRMRNRNQLKLRWERIKKPVTEFNGCYARISKVHQSGMSDDQKMDQAMQLYASEHSDKPFTMLHAWRILRHEKKWAAFVKKLSKEKSTSTDPTPVVNVEDAPKQRPIGRQKAKEERNGKRKEPEAISAIGEKLDKFIDATTKAEKIAEVQQSLASKKLEVAREQTKSKMLDLYRDLLCAPTSELSEEAKAERSKALELMASTIFPKDN
ncbi:unnamed protein product [Urochloa decumbens]|uniref:Myb-like domain-containing protein n=1 Tax=Urochloa decumbens TaxID=240449 RepID=A0ABC9BLR3_9POAL